MDKNKQKKIKRDIRHTRVRSVVIGTAKRPRLNIFRSGKNIYAQIIDDSIGKTLVSASSVKAGVKGKKIEQAKIVGKILAEQSLLKNISEVVFDRGGYKYHGRIKSLAEGAREGGLKF